MSPENNQRLLASYPKIFTHVRYCSVGDGWFDLINSACNLIQQHIDQDESVSQLVALQIKEKFGELRFYYQGGNHDCEQVIESVQAASVHICEVCGDGGKPRTNRGWVKTLCDKHAAL